MLSSKQVLLYGLSEEQLERVHTATDGRVAGKLLEAESCAQIVRDDYHAVIINTDVLQSGEATELHNFFTQVNSGSAAVILFGEHNSPLHSITKTYFEKFDKMLVGAIDILNKTHRAAERTENTAHNIRNTFKIHDALEKGNCSTKTLSEVIGRGEDAVKKYLELLCLAGFPIAYNVENKVWSLKK